MPLNYYTEQEKEFIRRNYMPGGMTVSQIARAVNKGPIAIKSFLFRRNIIKQPHKIWTEDDLETLRLSFRNNPTSVASLANRLGRTVFALRAKAAEIGLVRVGKRLWTEKEHEFLRENVGRYSASKLSDMLHRSKNAVIIRIKMLKLHRSDRTDWYTTTEAANILGCSRTKIRGLIQDKKLYAVPHYSETDNRCWEISRAALKRFICKYPGELQGRNLDIVQIVDILATNGVIYDLKVEPDLMEEKTNEKIN